jgi:hypothetical protein
MGYLATAQVLRLNITQEVIADGHKIMTTQKTVSPYSVASLVNVTDEFTFQF